MRDSAARVVVPGGLLRVWTRRSTWPVARDTVLLAVLAMGFVLGLAGTLAHILSLQASCRVVLQVGAGSVQ